jgi:hypothetical protein
MGGLYNCLIDLGNVKILDLGDGNFYLGEGRGERFLRPESLKYYAWLLGLEKDSAFFRKTNGEIDYNGIGQLVYDNGRLSLVDASGRRFDDLKPRVDGLSLFYFFPELQDIAGGEMYKDKKEMSKLWKIFAAIAGVALFAAPVAISGCISKPVEKPKPPKPPVAVMDGNFACKSGESIFFNASKSYDPDGNITGYKWIFGDGNETDWLNEPTINHTYFYKGKFKAYGKLIVKDNDNMTDGKYFYVSIEPIGDELLRYGGDAFWKSQYGDEFWKSRIYYDGMCIVGPESFQYNASLILAFMEKFVPQDYSFVKQHTKYFRWDKNCTFAFASSAVIRTTDVSSCADCLIEDKNYVLRAYAQGFAHEAAHHKYGANETLAYEIGGKCWDNITYALLKASGKFSESDIELYVNKSSPMNEQRYNQYYDLRRRMDYTINNMQGDFVKNFNFTDVARRKITYPKD